MSTFLAKPRKDGTLDFGSPHNESRWRTFCQDNEDKRVRIDLPKAKRSDQQHRYYWLYLGIVSMETGHEAQELHEYFKRVHLPPKFITVMDREIRIPASTKDLTKAEFGEYLDRICAEVNVPLPNPEDAGFINN